MKTRVVLVRHGQSTYNAQKLIQGHCDDSGLTELGEQQARKVGAALVGIPFEAVYSSPLQRASRTATLIVEVLRSQIPQIPTPILDADLREISLPLWEGISFKAAENQYPAEFKAWRSQPETLKMRVSDANGAETDFYPVRSLFEQAQRFWQFLLDKHRGQTLLLVAHSAINRALIGTALSLGPEQQNALHQANCGISILNFAGGWGEAVQLESMNITSHMGEALPEMRSRHQGPRLLLVRHGETEWNRQKRFQGQIDIPLNANGQVQAEKAAEFLKTVQIDAAVTSPLLRPKATAEAILKYHPHLKLEVEDRLKEIGHGDWEGKLEAEIEASYPGLLAQWQSAPETVKMPGEAGETLDQVWERAIAGWQKIVADYSDRSTPVTVMVSAHDAVNKAILCHVVGLGPAHFWCFKQGNGAVSVIDYPAGVHSRPVLSASNITTHLSDSIFDRTAAGAL
ncbi:histidine phosphatase family protein [Almyronema epifaneia]|uniref:Histidine phosphatase family protein n=1 Tax=Almyronema epifaneia S1 TaxID=2991925 RepID=A0ABW6ICI1_9CYAN